MPKNVCLNEGASIVRTPTNLCVAMKAWLRTFIIDCVLTLKLCVCMQQGTSHTCTQHVIYEKKEEYGIYMDCIGACWLTGAGLGLLHCRGYHKQKREAGQPWFCDIWRWGLERTLTAVGGWAGWPCCSFKGWISSKKAVFRALNTGSSAKFESENSFLATYFLFVWLLVYI